MFLINFYGLIWFYSPFVMRSGSIIISEKPSKKKPGEWVELSIATLIPFRRNDCVKMVHISKFDYKTNPKIKFNDIFPSTRDHFCVLIWKFQVKKKFFNLKTLHKVKAKRLSEFFLVYKFYTDILAMMMNVSLICKHLPRKKNTCIFYFGENELIHRLLNTENFHSV